MPLTAKGEEIKSAMEHEYGEKGEQVFYASQNAGTISGVEKGHDSSHEEGGHEDKHEDRDHAHDEGGDHDGGREGYTCPPPSFMKVYK